LLGEGFFFQWLHRNDNNLNSRLGLETGICSVQIVQITIFRVNKDGLGGLLTVFLGILISVLVQKTVCQEGVNVC
jgi:hypothetical protein